MSEEEMATRILCAMLMARSGGDPTLRAASVNDLAEMAADATRKVQTRLLDNRPKRPVPPKPEFP